MRYIDRQLAATLSRAARIPRGGIDRTAACGEDDSASPRVPVGGLSPPGRPGDCCSRSIGFSGISRQSQTPRHATTAEDKDDIVLALGARAMSIAGLLHALRGGPKLAPTRGTVTQRNSRANR